MSRLQFLLTVGLALLCVAALGSAGSTTTATCDGDTCKGSHSTVLAIAHDYNDPANTILYRVTLPEQVTGTAFGDGTNGFFYRTSTDGGSTYSSIVPFNGIGMNAAGAPTLRPFSFIVKAPSTATALTVEACVSNYLSDATGGAECNKVLWSDDYSALPSPTVAASTLPSSLALEYLSNSVTVRNNGVYGARVLLKPSATATLTEAQIEWLYDHLVFLDANSNVYTNDVLADSTASPSFAALSVEEAAHPTTSAGTTFNTKYGQIAQPVTPNDPSVTPNRYFWVYSTNTSNAGSGQSVPISVGWLYDASADCPGALSGDDNSKSSTCGVPTPPPSQAASDCPDPAAGDGSGAANCTDPGQSQAQAPAPAATQAPAPAQAKAPSSSNTPVPAPALGASNAVLEMTVLDGTGATVQSQSQYAAGTRYVRTVSLVPTDTSNLCTAPVNPLAVNDVNAVNLPNYVIDRKTASSQDPWTKVFPSALYYLEPTGFGNCDGAEAPFCQLTSSYTAYVPGYVDENGLGGSLNGNSTSSPLLGSANGTFKVFDQYTLNGLAEAGTNTLVWFDNCGYGHLYEDESLSGRLKLPPGDKISSLPVFNYTVTNKLDEPIVFAKECCASLYQENANNCTQEQNGQLTNCAYDPPQQIGTSVADPELAGSGLYVPAGGSVEYSTLFSDELTTAYSAITGLPLFELRLMAERSTVLPVAGSATLYECVDPAPAVALTGSGANWSLEIGAGGTGALTCDASENPQGLCPWPMFYIAGTGALAGYTTCALGTQTRSSLVLDVGSWAEEVLSDSQPVWVMAWGAAGSAGTKKGSEDGGAGGSPGFAITMVAGSDLKSVDGLYAYLGSTDGNSMIGGSSSILSKKPLTAMSPQQRATSTPGDVAYVIAGGGGGGGSGAKDFGSPFYGGAGGRGGVACANASTMPSSHVSVQGSDGARACHPPGDGGCSSESKCNGGDGGNSNGAGNAGGGNSGGPSGSAGIGGFGAYNGWLISGSLVPVGTPMGTGDGGAEYNYGGSGAGGYGGGGSGSSCSGSGGAGSGGGGGGSFAAANTAHDPNFPSTTSCTAPADYHSAVVLAYAGEGIALPGALTSSTDETPTACLSAPNDQGYVLKSGSGWSLFWQSDANLVLLDENGLPKWSTGAGKSGDTLCFQSDGNLVIYSGGSPRWASGTGDEGHGGNGGRRLAFNGACEVAVLDPDSKVLWSTQTSCD